MKMIVRKCKRKWNPLRSPKRAFILTLSGTVLIDSAFLLLPFVRKFVSNGVIMKRRILLFAVFMAFSVLVQQNAVAQCSVCTRSAQQLGEKPAKGMNAGILYLAFAPFAIIGYIVYRWRKNEQVQ